MNILNATIASGSTTSDEIDLLGNTICGIFTPPALTGTSFTFEAKDTYGNYLTMVDGAGASITKTVGADNYLPLNPQDFVGVGTIRIVSSASETADRLLQLSIKVLD